MKRFQLSDLAFAVLNFMVVYSLWPIQRTDLWELAAGLGTVWYSWAFSFVIAGALKAKWDRIVLGKKDGADESYAVVDPWESK